MKTKIPVGKILLSSILAGIFIGFGCLVYLSVWSPVAGAALFSVGLFGICTFGFYLFTGKVCYIHSNFPVYLAYMVLIWIGNLAGTFLMSLLVRFTRISRSLIPKADVIWQVKLHDGYLSLFLLGILCNIMIFLAVDGFRQGEKEPIRKYLSILLGVMVFILIGAEHCVADMFYLCLSGNFGLKSWLVLLFVTMGNTVGGILIFEMMTFLRPVKKSIL